MVVFVESDSGSSRSLQSTTSTGLNHGSAMKKQLAQSPTSTARNKLVMPKRSVTFSKTVSVRPVLHVFNYSDSEFHATWCVEKDYKRIKMDNLATLKMLKEGKKIDEDDKQYSVRGLEGSYGPGTVRRRKNKQRARDAVLDEQELQRDEGVCDTELMADVYYGYSHRCQSDAHLRALRDQHIARKYDNA
uniref:Uncharacterized protein n=1 Tax=Craspedostauros australis TaxID=1486917 RepID=A0A7S0F747_9STRA|mmetsp:Transcript_9888/g.26988  ORF Transcript_9888/g.26988 Transcript_9888/m.26988 type:complete len:189 (+) Transcript_9888:196-762(+)